jgi:hypothetical protein
VINTLRRCRTDGNASLDLFAEIPQAAAAEPEAAPLNPHLQLPAHHDVQASDALLRRLHGTLAAAAERGPKDFAELLLSPGVGARTVASLAFGTKHLAQHRTRQMFLRPATDRSTSNLNAARPQLGALRDPDR